MRNLLILLVVFASAYGLDQLHITDLKDPSVLPTHPDAFHQMTLKAQANYKTSELVFGGSPAAAGQLPMQVFLNYQKNDGNYYMCGGTLISTTHILTAAHCAINVTEAKIMVGAVRRNDRSDNAQWRDVHRVIRHGQYNIASWGKQNDIAVMEFNPAVVLNRDTQLTKIIEDDDELIENNNVALVSGFGTYAFQGNNSLTSSYLRFASVTVYPFDRCNRIWNGRLRQSQICAGGKKRGAGPGDSGGPIQVIHKTTLYQVGLTSFGPSDPNRAQNSQDQFPAVYTRVSSFCSFINQATGGVASCGRLDGSGGDPTPATGGCTPTPPSC